MKTVLPEVSLSQLSGVSSTALESAMVAAINTLVNMVFLLYGHGDDSSREKLTLTLVFGGRRRKAKKNTLYQVYCISIKYAILYVNFLPSVYIYNHPKQLFPTLHPCHLPNYFSWLFPILNHYHNTNKKFE